MLTEIFTRVLPVAGRPLRAFGFSAGVGMREFQAHFYAHSISNFDAHLFSYRNSTGMLSVGMTVPRKKGRPPMDEGTKKQRINLTLNPDLVDEAESYRIGKNITSLSALVELALRREMDSEKSVSAPMAIKDRKSTKDRIIAFPEIPLLHAAAGEAIDAHAETYQPVKDTGRGRFAVQVHGDSMWPAYPDGSILILRERESLRKPVLKKGEIYLFDIAGNKTLKVFSSRPATKREITLGLSYVSKADGKEKVRVLKALNPAFDDIRVTDDVRWIGWLDKKDNRMEAAP